MTHKDKTRGKFYVQKREARYRGIAFEFTFEEWVAWWEEQLGPHWRRKRGRKSYQFVMARKNDKGSYSIKNVICITQSQNMSESHLHTKRKIDFSWLGLKHSKKTKLKMSKIKLGKRNPFYGKKHTTKTRKKMSDNSRWKVKEIET